MPPTQQQAEQKEEEEERAEGLAGGLWGSEHGRVLKGLATASSSVAVAASPFLPSTSKLPPSQPSRPSLAPTSVAVPTNGGIKTEHDAQHQQQPTATVAAAPTPTQALAPIDRERSALARTLPGRKGQAPVVVQAAVERLAAGRGETLLNGVI
jgi:hypothetical protein